MASSQAEHLRTSSLWTHPEFRLTVCVFLTMQPSQFHYCSSTVKEQVADELQGCCEKEGSRLDSTQ